MRKQDLSLIALHAVLLVLVPIFSSCEKEETFAKATVETSQILNITEATATFVGILITDGGSDVTTRGFCWSTSPIPTIENDTSVAALGTPVFSDSIKGLIPGATYYVRAYAINKGGVSYGQNELFTTKTFSIATTPISVSLLTATSAVGGGSIISNGDSSALTVVARGVCWNSFPSPTIENSRTKDGIGGGRFTSTLDSLAPFTTYYLRAYATNINGTIYGNEVSFTTLSGVIGLTTSAASLITAFTATSGGDITSDGGAAVTESGLCWNTSPSPTISNSKTTNEGGIGTFSSIISGLSPNTIYYVRSYGINRAGTSYGNEVSFTTQSGVIGLTTSAGSLITAFTATSGGNVTSDGGAAVTERGLCWNTSTNPTTTNNKASNGSGLGSYSTILTGLTPGVTYYLRSYGVNSVGTTYGNEVSFTTQNGIIELNTSVAFEITEKTAMIGGTITSDGGAAVTARGICWSSSPNPTTANNKTTEGEGVGSFTSSLTGLSANTNYYARSYGTNSFGTIYGNEVSFSSSEIVTDIDGNVYSTAKIGTQVWMVGNLKTTKYNNGVSIPLISNGSVWSNLSTPGYCWYGNDAVNNTQYGALYNWYTVNNGQLAPTGWHVPTDADWSILEDFLKTHEILNGYTKGFAALSGGYRQSGGSFENIGNNCYWWSSTETNSNQAWNRILNCNNSILSRDPSLMRMGFSVRCIKNK